MFGNNAYKEFLGKLGMAAAILLLASCARIETDGLSDRPMQFRSYTPRAVTKASGPGVVAGTALPDNSNFGVFAFYQPGVVGSSTGVWGNGGASSSWSPDFMFNQQVLFSSGAYSYSPLRYWPANEENTISFWAYWPYEIHASDNSGALKFYQDNACTEAYTSGSTGLPVIKYTVPTAQAEQYDLMFDSFESRDMTWDNCSESSSGLDGTVPLQFRHALSQVLFNVSISDEVSNAGGQVTIKSVSLTGVNTVGTCLNPIAPVADEEAAKTYWTSVGTPQTLSFNIATSPTAAFILMPQTLAEDGTSGHSVVGLTLTFDISFPAADDPNARVAYADNELTAYIWTSSYGTKFWLPGRKYVYNIVAGLTEIEFSEVFTETWTATDEISL